jgi:hypothetical protein
MASFLGSVLAKILLFQLLSLHSARFAFRYHFTSAFVFASRDSLYVQTVEIEIPSLLFYYYFLNRQIYLVTYPIGYLSFTSLFSHFP